MERSFVVEVPNDVRAIERVVELVVRRCRTCDSVARKFHLNFRVGLAEALANAMLYGNGEDPGKRVRVEVTVCPCRVSAHVTYQGDGFDPDAVADPTTPENLLRPGGRGLFRRRQLRDEVRYNERGNSVTLVMMLDEVTTYGEAASA